MRRRKKRTVYTSNQLCWECKNSTGGCSWSRSLQPVEGWYAEPSFIKDSASDIGGFNTYKVIGCPQFQRG